ncbi:hypothetical protein QW131_12990 [Roseibium salinum]|nr:hypothetical protein [Roseibium salinum]
MDQPQEVADYLFGALSAMEHVSFVIVADENGNFVQIDRGRGDGILVPQFVPVTDKTHALAYLITASTGRTEAFWTGPEYYPPAPAHLYRPCHAGAEGRSAQRPGPRRHVDGASVGDHKRNFHGSGQGVHDQSAKPRSDRPPGPVSGVPQTVSGKTADQSGRGARRLPENTQKHRAGRPVGLWYPPRT